MSRQQSTGFTLLELMVTIVIMAILLALALPSFQSSLRSNRVATGTNELLASLSLARSEGIRSTRGGGVCSSADGATCGGDWDSGWIVWTEVDGDGVLDAGETVVRYSQGKQQLDVEGTAAEIAFDGRGRIMASNGEAIDLAPAGQTEPARCIQITVTGQTRMLRTACP